MVAVVTVDALATVAHGRVGVSVVVAMATRGRGFQGRGAVNTAGGHVARLVLVVAADEGGGSTGVPVLRGSAGGWVLNCAEGGVFWDAVD